VVSGKGGKGRGRGSGGGGGGGRRGGPSAPSSEVQAFYRPSFVENPWHALFNEPRTTDLGSTGAVATTAAADAGSQAPPPSDLPVPSQLNLPAPGLPALGRAADALQPAVPPRQEALEALLAEAAELDGVLRGVSDPSLASVISPVIREACSRVRSMIRVSKDSSAAELPPKRSRIALPPPLHAGSSPSAAQLALDE